MHNSADGMLLGWASSTYRWGFLQLHKQNDNPVQLIWFPKNLTSTHSTGKMCVICDKLDKIQFLQIIIDIVLFLNTMSLNGNTMPDSKRLPF